MDTGKKIKSYRIDNRLTQKKLGEKLGVTAVTIGQWETGKRKPKIETLNKIADALNISVRNLIGVTFDNEISQNSIDEHKGKELEQLFHGIFMSDQEENLMQIYNIFDCLNEIGQRVAIERLEELAEIPKYQRTSDQEEE